MLKVVAEAGDGAEAVERIRELQPDVAVLDIDMPHKNGFEVVRELQSVGCRPAIIFLTMHRDEALFNGAFDLGAQGYLLKDSAIADIVVSIQAVAKGRKFHQPLRWRLFCSTARVAPPRSSNTNRPSWI